MLIVRNHMARLPFRIRSGRGCSAFAPLNSTVNDRPSRVGSRDSRELYALHGRRAARALTRGPGFIRGYTYMDARTSCLERCAKLAHAYTTYTHAYTVNCEPWSSVRT